MPFRTEKSYFKSKTETEKISARLYQPCADFFLVSDCIGLAFSKNKKEGKA
jgi:hypothetical protein